MSSLSPNIACASARCLFTEKFYRTLHSSHFLYALPRPKYVPSSSAVLTNRFVLFISTSEEIEVECSRRQEFRFTMNFILIRYEFLFSQQTNVEQILCDVGNNVDSRLIVDLDNSLEDISRKYVRTRSLFMRG